jgi:hypothetical protein
MGEEMNINEVKLHMIRYNGRWLTWTRYHNSNGFVSAIVAVIFALEDGRIVDWSAYMGGSHYYREEEKESGIKHIAEYTGGKISVEDAAYFFPNLPLGLWRG